MARYQMLDGTVVDTERATQHWDEDTRWNGSNHISVATNSQWVHQTLYRSRKGRYWLETTSQYQGSTPRAEWVSPEQAAAWLDANDHNIPDDLAAVADSVAE